MLRVVASKMDTKIHTIVTLFLVTIVVSVLKWENLPKSIHYFETTCSPRAFSRGSGQKVVSYAFYTNTMNRANKEKRRHYLQGIRINLDLVTKYYPGYVMRLYIEVDPDDPTLAELKGLEQNSTNFDLCDIRNLPGTPMTNARMVFPMVWRFFPTMDPQVDVYACRDLDSRIFDREIHAVKEFLKSGKALHSMRDHYYQPQVLVGCCWGANLTAPLAREKWRMAWHGMLGDAKMWVDRGSYGADQGLLRDHVWRAFEGPKNTMQHDAYHCEKHSGSLPWPTQRPNTTWNFVGGHLDINRIRKECPMACRPKLHPDWLLC